ncbi:MAG: hypothetical protein V4502_10340 [Pseudomonadota bacterium]
MNAAQAQRIERNVVRTASALFAVAVAFAAYSYWSPTVAAPMLGAYTAALGAAAYLVSAAALAALTPRPRYPVPMFDLRKIDPAPMDELLLTEDLRPADAGAGDDPLLLDDILAELGPDSRVVRLFDPSAMPTPGQLTARIEQHLGKDGPPVMPHDASEALFDALDQLRRSLR